MLHFSVIYPFFCLHHAAKTASKEMIFAVFLQRKFINIALHALPNHQNP
jgi:hypothetical protein